MRLRSVLPWVSSPALSFLTQLMGKVHIHLGATEAIDIGSLDTAFIGIWFFQLHIDFQAPSWIRIHSPQSRLLYRQHRSIVSRYLG